jgi:FkbM family methyltransferase
VARSLPTMRLPRIGFWAEHVWLRLLSRLARGYSWVEFGGMVFFGASHHNRLLWRMRKRSFERVATELFIQDIRQGTVVVDVGAYVGYYTILAARKVGPSGRVYSFECFPENYRFLLHNIRANGVSDRVITVPQAASNETGRLPFFVRGGDLTAGSLWRHEGAKRVFNVETTTVDEVLEGQQVGVAKIDVEGGELRVLEGMENTIARSNGTTMVIECYPHLLAAAGASARDLVDRLRDMAFDVQVIEEARRSVVELDDKLLDPAAAEDPTYYRNLYCRKRIASPR